jgi:hypothetical protein
MTIGFFGYLLSWALILAQGDGKPSGQDTTGPRPGEAATAGLGESKQALDPSRPNSVILSVEQYEALLERLQKLEKPTPERRTHFLNACRISGQVTAAGPARWLADVQLELEFRTVEKDLVLPIGLKGARLTKALLDDQPPVWASSGEGLALRLGEPKVYRLVLHLQPTVTQIGQESRLLIENLPQAAITTLDLTVPAQVTAAQVVGSGPLSVERTESNRSRLRSDALGVLTQLDLRWQTPNPEPETGNLQVVVHADTHATLEDTVLDTESRIRIEVRQGSFDRLAFRIPKEITLLQVETEGRSDPVDSSFEPGSGQFVVRPRSPLGFGQPPLELRVRTQQPFPDKSGRPLSVGWLELLDIPRKQQTGTIVFFASGDRRVRFQPVEAFRIDPREVSPGTRPALFAARYWRQPARVDLLVEPGATLAAQAAVKPSYALTFTGKQIHAAFSWEITPRNRTPCQEIDLHWPAGFVLDRNSLLSGPVESVQAVDGSPETVRVRLVPRQTAKFTLKAEGVLSLGEGEIHALPLAFVSRAATEREGRLEGMQLLPERGEARLLCQATDVRVLSAQLPLYAEDGKLLALPFSCGPSSVVGLRHPELGSSQLEVAVQPLRHQVRSSADVCVTSAAWEIEQRLIYRFVGPPPTELWLRVPRVLQDRLQAWLRYTNRSGEAIRMETALTERGPRPLVPTDVVERLLPLPQDVGEQCEIVLAALLPLAETPGRLSVRCAAPGPQERLVGPASIRVWTSARVKAVPVVEEGNWNLTMTAFSEPGNAPDWQLHAPDLTAPLLLDLSERHESASTTLVVDEARVQLAAPTAGRFLVRVALRFDPVRQERILLRLPLDRSEVRLERLLVNGTEQRPQTVSDSEDVPGSCDLVVALSPRHLRGPVRLEMTLPWRSGVRPLGFAWQRLPTVDVPQADAVHEVVWQLEPNRGATPLLWSGWAEPMPDQSAFQQRGTLEPPTVWIVPKLLWTLLVSATVFVIAVGLFYSPRPFAVVLALLLAWLLVGLMFWKYHVWLGVLYGSWPGVAVSVGLLGLAWMRRQRWRRKVTYLPGFTRSTGELARSRSSVQRLAPSAPPSNGSTRITPKT